jgi:hypothetical protein
MAESRISEALLEFLALLVYGASRIGPRRLQPRFAENIDDRATKYLNLLDSPPTSLRFQIAIRNLERETDLLWEHAMYSPAAMQLQAQVIHAYATKKLPRNPQLGNQKWNPPLYVLFAAILEQAALDRATTIRVHFRRLGEHRIVVEYDIQGNPMDAISIPRNIRIDWLLRLMTTVGYPNFRPILTPFANHNLLPDRAQIHWETPDICELVLQ